MAHLYSRNNLSVFVTLQKYKGWREMFEIRKQDTEVHTELRLHSVKKNCIEKSGRKSGRTGRLSMRYLSLGRLMSGLISCCLYFKKKKKSEFFKHVFYMFIKKILPGLKRGQR